jgi:DNA-binding SARP family transcriptional activator
VHVFLLGPVEIACNGRKIQLNGRHQRAIVAALASEPAKVVPAERLIDVLWGQQPPSSAWTKLQGCVSGLRKQLRGTNPAGTSVRWPIVTRDPGYLFSDEGVTVDLVEYRTLLQRAAQETDTERWAAASGSLGAALELWRGPAFADTRTPVLSAMAVALESGRLLALERKAECDLRLGRYATVAQELGLTLAVHPAREGMRAAMMLALYRSGCRAEALESSRAGRALLRERLGIEPGPLLRRLHEMILRDDPQLAMPGALADLNQVMLPAT